MKTKNDLPNYFKMEVPYEGAEEANKALQGFHEELSELRKKYKITDVLIVTSGYVKYPDGQIGQYIQHSGYGNSLSLPTLAAYAYGQTQAEGMEKLNRLMAGEK